MSGGRSLRVRGVLEFFTREIKRRDPELLTMLHALGDRIARFIERAELLERIESLARVDELTGLPNRRAWEEALPTALRRAVRQAEPISLALLDLDHFKRFNDEHGHPAGDALLRAIGEAWSSALRVTDLLARYGGEEFALLLPGAGPEDALEVAERVRRATPGGQRCSAGVATWNGSESGAGLLARADAALYAANRAGRDRVAVDPCEPPRSADLLSP